MTTLKDSIEAHQRLDKVADRMTAAEYARRQQQKAVSADSVDRVRSEIIEEEEAAAFGAGLTVNEYRRIFDTHGDLGVQIIEVLTLGYTETEEGAIQYLYHGEPNSTDDWIDRLTTASGKRVHQFGQDLFGEMSDEEFAATHPRRRGRPKSKKDIQDALENWRRELEMQSEFDESIDGSMHGG